MYGDKYRKNTDEGLRQAEREWRASGSSTDFENYLLEMIRARKLDIWQCNCRTSPVITRGELAGRGSFGMRCSQCRSASKFMCTGCPRLRSNFFQCPSSYHRYCEVCSANEYNVGACSSCNSHFCDYCLGSILTISNDRQESHQPWAESSSGRRFCRNCQSRVCECSHLTLIDRIKNLQNRFCANCRRRTCSTCDQKSKIIRLICKDCNAQFCGRCETSCASCNVIICPQHSRHCDGCGRSLCSEHGTCGIC